MSRKKTKLPDANKGLRCPRCNCADMRSESGWNVRIGRRRKRICRNCGHHVLTIERVAADVEQTDDKVSPSEGASAN